MAAAAALLSKFFSNLHSFSFFLALLLSLTPSSASHEFRVGGPTGTWVEPAGDESAGTYNHWASRTRFHVGDSIYFEYENDSVLEVDKEHYKECNGTDPVARFDDGGTTFRFHRYGFFFFISGEPGHCEMGQRMIVRVMVHPGGGGGVEAPSPAALELGSSETGMSGRPAQSTSDAASTSTAAAAAMMAAVAVPAAALAAVNWLKF